MGSLEAKPRVTLRVEIVEGKLLLFPKGPVFQCHENRKKNAKKSFA